jgi:PadR family transcriptional regulator, regulatory protein PadR
MYKLRDSVLYDGIAGAESNRQGPARRAEGVQVQRRRYTKRTGADMWASQLRKGSLALAVLASLWDGELYGAEIRCRLEQLAGFAIVPGVIYPILRRLEKTHFVESEWIDPQVGHPRRNFRLTANGRRCVVELCGIWKEFVGGMNRVLAAPNERTHVGPPASLCRSL